MTDSGLSSSIQGSPCACADGPSVARAFLERSAIGSSSRSSGSVTRAKSDGVGLGLAVPKGFLEAMGGEIEADDTPGGGLTIVARLRAAE